MVLPIPVEILCDTAFSAARILQNAAYGARINRAYGERDADQHHPKPQRSLIHPL